MDYVELAFCGLLQGERKALPPFLGATLRGVLGYLLKQTVCQVSHGRCEQCLLRNVCPYPSVFEGIAPPGRDILRKYAHIPQPFVLLVPPASRAEPGERTIRWGVRLFGPAARYWPYLVHVFDEAGRQGVGRAKAIYELTHVRDGRDGPVLWNQGDTSWSEPTPRRLLADRADLPPHCTLRWRFYTPLKLHTSGRTVDGRQLLGAGLRRYQIMTHFYGEPAAEDRPWLEADAFTTRDSRLRSWGFQRFSGRQRRRMPLGGVLGETTIEGPWGLAGNWLHAAPILHLGKATSFGFGHVDWEIV